MSSTIDFSKAAFCTWIGLMLLSSAVGFPQRGDRGVIVSPVPEETKTSEGFDPSESAGLFVGITNYDDSRLIPVPFAVDDAVDLAYLFSLRLRLIDPGNVALSLEGEPRKPVSSVNLQTLLHRRRSSPT